MSFGINAFNSYQGVGRSADYAANFMNANQARMDLANQVDANLSPQALFGAHQLDKSLELDSVQNKTLYEMQQAMDEANDARSKKEWARKREAIESGLQLFV